MKKSVNFILTGMFLLVSSSLILSQAITTSGKTARNGFTTANRATLLYEQLPSGTNTNAYTSQEFSDYPTMSNEGADDFIVPADAVWTIETVTAWGGGWNGFITTNVVNVKFYNDNSGQPDATPFQSFLGTPYTYPVGYPEDFIITLPSAVVLPPGHYWLSVAMVGDFGTNGQWGRNVAAAVSNYQARWINPGGGFGNGPNWNPASVITGGTDDWAFRLEGTSGGGEAEVPISNWALFIGIGLILIAAVIRFRRLI